MRNLDALVLGCRKAAGLQLSKHTRLSEPDVSRIDLNKMTAAVLAGFGYVPRQDERLPSLLIQALRQGHSNADIDALLNTAAAQGGFIPPRQLVL